MSLYVLKKEDINKAAKVLANAFFYYPIYTKLIKDEKVRYDFLFGFMKIFIKEKVKKKRAFATSPNLEGVFMYENKDKKPKIFSVLSGLKYYKLKKILKKDYKDFMEKFMSLKTADVYFKDLDNYVYVLYIGIDEKYRGQGFMKEIINDLNLISKKQKFPLVLETNNERNEKIYNHYGYETVFREELHEIMNIVMINKNNF